jgi:hypothetical protein
MNKNVKKALIDMLLGTFGLIGASYSIVTLVWIINVLIYHDTTKNIISYPWLGIISVISFVSLFYYRRKDINNQ